MENKIENSEQDNPKMSVDSNVQPVVASKTNYSVLIIVAVLSALVFGFGGYYLGQQSLTTQNSNELKTVDSSETLDEDVKVSPTSVSNVITPEGNIYNNQYFSFMYPKSWQLDNTIIYEFRSNCNPETFRCLNQRNIVDIRSNTTQIYQGYSNEQWFNKIATLNSPWTSDGDVFTKLANGKTLDGENYVIFKQGPSASFEGESLNLIIGYVLKGNNIYELRLSHFDSESLGLKLLQSLLETLKIK